MLLLVNLPDVIIRYVQSFLHFDDIHYFLNSNKLYFSSLKREMIYFSLNKKKSQEYVEDERFREMILSKVKDGSRQIGLSFDRQFTLPDIRDIVAHKIDFGGSYYPHFPEKVSSLVMNLPNKVTEIRFLPMLQELQLSNCINIKDFSNLSHLKRLELHDATQLTDITPLQNIPDLSFINCPNIENLSILSSKKQHTLFLSQTAITDVSFLRHIQTVDLCYIDDLIDVSPLYGIKNLLLYGCFSIQDISCLGNHHKLTIADCRSIERGYECFRTVRHAEVLGYEVPDVCVFQEAKSLRITFFRSMESQFFLLRDISDLALVTYETDRKEVYNITHLRNRRLSLYEDIIKIHNCNFPSQLRHLRVERCDQIVKIINEGKTSIFQHLQSLHIIDCWIEHVNGLGDIPTLILESCFKLHDISGLGRNRCVELNYCPKIHDVRNLDTVPIVTMKNCNGILDFSCLSSVPRLKIVFWGMKIF